uniref:RNA-directed DNA polymerase n=3 Tax=Photinus pyralis TaxID=7054 RepID=A0A1Y1NHV7_PHOPY
MAVSCNVPAKLVLEGNLSENWRRFAQSFDIYLLASGLDTQPDKRKIAVLLNLIGDEALEVYNTIKGNTTNNELKDVLAKLEEYCNPKKNVLHSRFIFNQRNQKEGEQFNSFYTDVKLLIGACEYSDADEILRDKLVFGSTNQDAKTKLIKEGNPKLDEVVKSLRLADITDIQVQNILSTQPNVHSTVTKQTRPKARPSFIKKTDICDKCGLTHFSVGNCPATNKTCAKCQKRNHFAKMCRSTRGSTQTPTYSRKQVHENILEDDEENYFCGSIIQANVDSVAWMETVNIENKMDVMFKLDPGADVNIIPVPIYKKLKKMSPSIRLQGCTARLESWNGFKTNVEGIVSLKIQIGKNSSYERFYVAGQEQSIPILSRDTCVKFKLVKRHHVNEAKVHMLKDDFVSEYKDLFEGIGKINKPYTIKLKEGSIPTSKPPHRVPIKIQPQLEAELQKLVRLDIISKVDNPTAWVNRLVVVEKPTGDIRICLDPRELNEAIVKDYYGIPTLGELSCKIKDANLFCVLDLKDSFWHIPLDDCSSNYCTFSTMYGMYKFKRLPFGLNIASEVFQKYLTEIFGDISGVFIYIDDILIFGQSKTDVCATLNTVFERASKFNIKFNLNKFKYMLHEVKYLGHIFSKGTVRPDVEVIKGICDYDMPTNKIELQRFLGVVNYLRAFIPDLAEITAPLRELLKKNIIFTWLDLHTETVNKLKMIITKQPVLQNFDHNKPVVIQTDASKNGIGCVLLQENKPVYYASKALSQIEINYGQIEKEFLAILFACKKFHNFIYGRKTTVYTDHLPLISLMRKEIIKIPSTRLQRIRLKLTIYDIDVKFLPGCKMHVADALSRACSKSERCETDSSLADVVHSVNISNDLKSKFQEQTRNDSILAHLANYFQNGWPNCKSKVHDSAKFWYNFKQDISVQDSIVYKDNKLVVPLALKPEILAKLHESHLGMTKTKGRAKNLFYWRNMNSDIEEYITNCKTCQKFSKNNVKEPMLLKSQPDLPFQIVACDILNYGNKDYLVLIDTFSKWIELVRLSSKTADSIIKVLKSIFSTHGIPSKLYADNMPFNSRQFRQFSQDWSFELTFSSPYYHQSNGLAERGVGICRAMLNKCDDIQGDIFNIMLEYRNTPVLGTPYSPAQLLFSRLCRTKLPITNESLAPKVVSQFRDELLKNSLTKKAYYDRTARTQTHNFVPGQKVLYKENDKSKTWCRGEIVNLGDNPRSFKIKDQNGRIKLRNTWFLKPLHSSNNLRTQQQIIPITFSDKPKFWSNTSKLIEIGEGEQLIAESRDEVNEQSTIRPIRQVRPPMYLRNYVCK